MDKVFIWRDKFDPNQFWIGVKNGKTFSGWIPCFCDTFSDCFGKDAWDEVKNIVPGADPVPITLKLWMQ